MFRLRLDHGNHDFQKGRNSNNQERQQLVLASAVASGVNEKIVIRSLRRRLCKALLREDPDEALRIYTATRSEWETLVCAEIELAEAEIAKRLKIFEREPKQQKGVSCNPISRRLLKKTPSQNGFLRQIETSTEMKALIDMAGVTLSHESSSTTSSDVIMKNEPAIPKWKVPQDGLLQIWMNPSDPFELDDYKTPFDAYEVDLDDQTAASSQCLGDKKEQEVVHGIERNIFHRPGRQAFSFFNRSYRNSGVAETPSITANNLSLDEDTSTIPPDILLYQNKMDMTTPLHEAARIGSYELVRTMLSSVSGSHFLLDCNSRNGLGRTILHCVMGGLTKKEIGRYVTDQAITYYLRHNETTGDGIMAPMPLKANVPPSIESSNSGYPGEKGAGSKLMTAAVAVGRFLRKSLNHTKDEEAISTPENREFDENSANNVIPLLETDYQHLQLERIEVAKYILSWSHPEDGSTQSGMGVSSNAVDIQNRTALHYAAALGRSELCVLLCNHFGTMLTIVDSASQTPCELAAANNWKNLAAQLEARALCYIDPDGTEEELLSSMSEVLRDSNNMTSSTPPFYWFETLTNEKVQQKRERRIEQALEKFRHIMKQKQSQTSHNHLLLDHYFISTTENALPSNIEDVESECMDITTLEAIQNSTSTPFDFVELLDQSHIERYLMFHSWNLKKALETFNDNPQSAFEQAGVAIQFQSNDDAEIVHKGQCEVSTTQNDCMICCESFEATSSNWMNLRGCPHGFCKECLGAYLTDCAKTKSTGLVVPCPHHDCKSLLTRNEVIALSPSMFEGKEMTVYSLLEETANDNFVVSEPCFRFCPHPGCGCAVRFVAPNYSKTTKLVGTGLLELVGGVCTAGSFGTKGQHKDVDDPVTYEGVKDQSYFSVDQQPKRAHRFCFKCGETTIHWPVTCDMLREWKEVVAKEVNDVANPAGGDNYNDLAQKMWMKVNTRPCPKCQVPIQKDEGCNHMTCRNPICQHEFCWICRNDWKLHSSDTGGFFRCNRWIDQRDTAFDDETIPTDDAELGRVLMINEEIDDPRTMEVTYGTSMFDTRTAKRKSKEMNRFLHHFQRWNAHSESAALERKMGATVCTRLAPVVEEAIRLNDGDSFIFLGKGLSFVHAAFIELLECRSMLQHSYAMSYFRYKSVDNRRYRIIRRRANEKASFEQFQAELELITEHISDIVARSHLRASMMQIMFLTKATAEKRKEFSNVMINILYDDMIEKENAQEAQDVNLTTNSYLSFGALAGHTLDTISGPGNSGNVNATYSSQSYVSDVENAVRRSLYQFLARSGANPSMNFDDDDSEMELDWACPICTYVNDGGTFCAMCQNHRR